MLVTNLDKSSSAVNRKVSRAQRQTTADLCLKAPFLIFPKGFLRAPDLLHPLAEVLCVQRSRIFSRLAGRQAYGSSLFQVKASALRPAIVLIPEIPDELLVVFFAVIGQDGDGFILAIQKAEKAPKRMLSPQP